MIKRTHKIKLCEPFYYFFTLSYVCFSCMYVCAPCVCVCLSVCAHLCLFDAHRGQKRILDPLELKLKMIVTNQEGAGDRTCVL